MGIAPANVINPAANLPWAAFFDHSFSFLQLQTHLYFRKLFNLCAIFLTEPIQNG